MEGSSPQAEGGPRPDVSLRWEVHETWGLVGGHRVWRATDTKEGGEVALRLLPRGILGDSTAIDDLRTATGRLKDLVDVEGVLTFHAFEVQDTSAYFVTEPFAGRTLQERLRSEGPLDENGVRDLARFLADTLAATHARKQVHGFLRPAGILMAEDGTFRISDFGLGAILDRAAARAAASAGVGGGFYAPPEAPDRPLPNAAMDQYMVGALLYEAATGRRAFPEVYVRACHRKLTPGAPFPDPVAGVSFASDRLRNILRRMLAPHFADRFPDMAAVSEALAGEPFDEAHVQQLSEVMTDEKRLAGVEIPKSAGPLRMVVFIVCGLLLIAAIIVWVFNIPIVQFEPAEKETGKFEEPPPVAMVMPDLPPPPKASLEGIVLPRGFVERDGRIWCERDGAEMVLVSPGPFPMGGGVEGAFSQPAGTVTLSAYLVDRHEVTVLQFRRYCAARGIPFPPQPDDTSDLHPVVNVNWEEAAGYALWAAKRLPTEAQWEKAARGDAGRPLPWGDEDDPRLRNGVGDEDGYAGPAAVASFLNGASPCGALDMVGNVWEWCRDGWAPSLERHAGMTDPCIEEPGEGRAVRGGSFSLHDPALRSWLRNYYPPGERWADLGFRCVREIP